jgi:predicted kinase
MPNLIVLIGPAGSGKSTLARSLINDDGDHGAATVYINQDSQGKEHLNIFKDAISNCKDIIVDRMNFNRQQRERYTVPAKQADYRVKFIVLHENKKTCLARCIARIGNHETIATEQDAQSALNLFFSKYERPLQNEADEISFRYPEGPKPSAIIVDLDGTLCNIDHRLHFVKREGRKDWKSFFEHLSKDQPNKWCRDLVSSGRPDNYQKQTQQWLDNEGLGQWDLFMRCRGDHRDDTIAKENILDFEVLTRYTPFFFIDDRKRVVDLWRRRGYTCLACHEGEF